MREIYKTKQKDIVEKFFLENEGCFKVEDIYKTLISKNEKIGKVTVYRRIEKLLLDGKLRKFTDNNASFYKLVEREDCHSHFHLKCVKCGKVTHLDCDKTGDVFEHINNEHNFKIDMSKTVLYGLCNNCGGEK